MLAPAVSMRWRAASPWPMLFTLRDWDKRGLWHSQGAIATPESGGGAEFHWVPRFLFS
jgi:hypothetical protein